MFVNDVLSDTIARVNNAAMAGLASTVVMNTKLSRGLLKILKEEGFVGEYEDDQGKKGFLRVFLRYDSGKSVINILKRISKPGRRVYARISELKASYNGLGMVILSTPKGIISDYQAKELNVGGELLCVVF